MKYFSKNKYYSYTFEKVDTKTLQVRKFNFRFLIIEIAEKQICFLKSWKFYVYVLDVTNLCSLAIFKAILQHFSFLFKKKILVNLIYGSALSTFW